MERTDILVLGGGVAGIVAATTAKNATLRRMF